MTTRKDTGLDQYKQSATNMQIYSDFDSSFLPHPFTKQITRRTNVEAVKMALRNLILTNKYERLRNPEFGGNIRRYLFENFSSTLAGEIEGQIKSIVRAHEPRVRILEVNVFPDEERNELSVTITFNIVSSPNTEELNLTLYRVR